MIAVYGGTFDPFHAGHLQVVRHTLKLLQPDTLRILPCYQSVLKEMAPGEAAHRLEIIRIALADLRPSERRRCVVDDREISAAQPVYTLDTLRGLRRECGERESLTFVMGADSLHHFHLWNGWQEIPELAHLAVFARPGYPLAEMPEPLQLMLRQRRTGDLNDVRSRPAGHIWIDETLAEDVSSSGLRENQRSHAAWLPEKVREYIRDHRLYNTPAE